MQISLAVLKNRNSGRLFFGQLISQACDKMMNVGLVWMFAERYPQAIIPWFLGFSALPHLLLAWKAGQWTTRWGQLKTLVGTDCFRGLLYIGLAAVWGGLRLDSQVPVLFGVSFIAGIGAALFNPAVLAAPIALVEAGEVQQLTALIDSCFAIGNILGPLLSAVLYPWLGLRGLFLFNGLSYWFAAFLEAGIRPKQNPLSAGGDSQPLPKSDSPGRILSRDRVLAVMLLGFLASNLFLAPLMVFLPLFVKAAYHEQIGTLAALEAAMGIGVVVGGAFLSTVRLDSSIGVKIAVGMSAVALAYLGFILSPAPVLGILCLAVLGFFLSMTNVFSMTLFQTRLEPQNVMTFMSLVNLISVASLPFSMTVLGMTVGSMGIRTIALVCGGSLVVVTLGVIARPDIRNL